MLNRFVLLLISLLVVGLRVRCQEATSGVSLPITVSGNTRATWTAPAENNEGSATTAGFRAILTPTLKLGPHWFAYSALDVHSPKYLSYETGSEENRLVEFELMQAFVGYSATFSKATALIKAGQLSSAFGLFPVEYDDSKMPLIDAPMLYTGYLPIRPDQLPCGVKDVLGQTYGSEVDYHCGGSDDERYGVGPATLYGLPAVEAEISISRLDARLQLTNSSPANPHGLTDGGQAAQWTAGTGYTLPGGLHLGVSGFRGPYLDKILIPLLPAGKTLRDFPAWGAGADAEWSRGRWSVQGEWQHFHFELPGFSHSPSENGAYGQAKCILSPRLFLAMRATAQHFGRIQDSSGSSADQFAGPQQVYDFSVGYRFNRQQLLKVGSSWMNGNSWSVDSWVWPQSNRYMLQAQLVTSVTAVAKAFR
ncbi:MAG TPA: hypothetical protein VLJ11_11250 [Bryobacteraceae bacterium]|nr:hypothetical protein [Bryobacteraceae bacterium]